MDAHNNYVLFTTEAGILGAVSMVTLMIGLILLGRRVEKRDDSDYSRILGVGFTISSVAVCLGNIYGSRFFDGDVMGNFWILAALAARYSVLPPQAPKMSIAATTSTLTATQGRTGNLDPARRTNS